MSQMISSGSAAATCSTKSHVLSGNCSWSRSMMTLALSTTRPSTRCDLFRREALRDDRAESEVLRIVHVDHRAEELVHLLWKVADVRPLSGAEERRVAADVPDVLVAGKGVVARPGRKRGFLDLSLGEVAAGPGCRAISRRSPRGRRAGRPRTPSRRARRRRARCRSSEMPAGFVVIQRTVDTFDARWLNSRSSSMPSRT